MNESSKETLKNLTTSAMYQPKEQFQPVAETEGKLTIGIPKEVAFQENRVALTPDAVRVLVNNGHGVSIETGTGLGSHFIDNEYSDAGAQIIYSTKQIFSECNLILKIAPPTDEEIEMLQSQQVLVSALQLSVQPKNYIQKLLSKGIYGIAWDYIKDQEGIFPIVRAMGEIAGNTSILIAGEYLRKSGLGQKAMFGGITGVMPTEVVIFGAGTVAEYATRAALGLGASVTIFEDSIYKLRRLQNDVGSRLKTSTIQPDKVLEALQSADVAIGALRSRKGRAPIIVTEEMVNQMKVGSIILDVSIDQGGNFETSEVTTHDKPVFEKFGVLHYGVPNIASQVSRTASEALSNIFVPMLLNFGKHGSFEEVLRKYAGLRNGVFLFNGYLTNKHLARNLGLPFKDLDLLLAAL